MDQLPPTKPPALNWQPAACTIIARNYLAFARVLGESFLTHQPGGRFYVLVIDDLPPGVDLGNDFNLIKPDDLGILNFYEMCFKYNVTELSTAVKPRLLRRLMDDYGESQVIYFDPDILIARPLDELREALTSSDIVLTPHLTEPIPMDGRLPGEQDILIAGAYNLGFLAIKRSDAVERFLDWWDARLQDNCRIDPSAGLFVDQKWVDLIPGFFPSVTILHDDTYNVAYWNLHSRSVTQRGSEYFVNDRPLAFFHFSGFDPRKPKALSKHQNRIQILGSSPLAGLLNLYAESSKSKDYAQASRWAYGYAFFENGVAVGPIFRRLYLELPPAERKGFGNPFLTSNKNSFFTWALTPDKEQNGLSPFLRRLYLMRPDVASTFPDVTGKDRTAFIQWAKTQGSREMGYDPQVVVEQEGLVAFTPPNEDRANVNDKTTSADHPYRNEGINVCGYLRNETGIGAVARGYVASFRSLNRPLALRDLSELSPNRSNDPTLTDFDRHQPYRINLVCVNADQHFVVKTHLGESYFRDHYNIGVWFWELPEFPKEYHDRFDEYDEIWAGSSYIANALSPVSPIPIVRIPPVLTVDSPGSRSRGRQRLGVGEHEHVFLFVFDFRSFFERKNPLALIDAFRQAFAPSDPVRLVIKCVNEATDPESFEALRGRAKGHRVSVHTGYWSLGEMRDLMEAADTYASLHRAEGLGLTIAEAMALGKPVIATGWSGNADFMTAANSFPVQYELTEIRQDVGPYRAGGMWAEPSVDHAALLMRQILDDPAAAGDRGRFAARDIAIGHSIEAVARVVGERLAVIERVLASRARVQAPAAASVSRRGNAKADDRSLGGSVELEPLYMRAPVVPTMDLQTSLYGRLGGFVKRGVSALLAYHTYYQRTVNLAFAQFMRDLAIEHHSTVERIVEAERDLHARIAGVEDEYRFRGDQLLARVAAVEEQNRATGEQLLARVAAVEEQNRATGEQLLARVAAVEEQNRVTGVEVSQVGARLAEFVEPRIDAVLDEARARFQVVEEKTAEMQARLAARPYMAYDAFGAFGDLASPMGYPRLDRADGAGMTIEHFPDLFRGSEEFIRERQRVYLPFIRGRSRVVDLGCGRGEFLGLLASEEIQAVGVELDAEQVHYCRQRGYDVVQSDAIDYLRVVPEKSLDAIFLAQVIEHLTLAQLTELLCLGHSRLHEDGLLIAETVNPESYEAMKAFYVDLTHQKPIFPQVLLQMCQSAGFRQARIFYPLGGGFTQHSYDRVGEYAVIATV